MKTLTVLSACALLTLAAPALAQNNSSSTMKSDLRANGSPDGVAPSHAKQPGDKGTESGAAPGMTEGRSSATDATGKPTPKMSGEDSQSGARP